MTIYKKFILNQQQFCILLPVYIIIHVCIKLFNLFVFFFFFTGTACQNLPVLDFAIETGVSSKLYAFEGDIESAMERINVCLRSLKLLDQQPSDIVCNEMIKQQVSLHQSFLLP